jgi:glycerol-3-phosphate dehydrogenase
VGGTKASGAERSAASRIDVVVVGGGSHGAGVVAAGGGGGTARVSRNAARRGDVEPVETLVHGAELRRLESMQLTRARGCATRAILLRAAGLVKLVAFTSPIYRDTRRRPGTIRLGLSLYALLGNFAPAARFERVGESEWGALDGLRTEGLQAVFRYFDGQTEDAALVRAVLRSAESLSARLLWPARFAGAKAPTTAEGRFAENGNERTCRARSLVNASGPWIEEVRRRIDPVPPGLEIELVGGAHVEFEGRLARGIYYTEAPSDGRAVFVMPWKDRMLVGTTETPFQGDPSTVQPLPSEIEYLKETLHYFPTNGNGRAFVGRLRVLPKAQSPFRRNGETTLVVDRKSAPRMVATLRRKRRATARRRRR